MADDSPRPEQPTSIEQDEAVAWRQEQFRRSKMAMRGLMSTDFGSGGGEFIEPVQSGQPIPQLYPEEQQLLAMATGTQFVSAVHEVPGFDSPPDIVPEGASSPIQESDSSPSFDVGQGTDIGDVPGAEIPSIVVSDPAVGAGSSVPLPEDGASLDSIEIEPPPSPGDVASDTVSGQAELPELDAPTLADIEPPPEAVAPDPSLAEFKPLWPPGKAGEDAGAAAAQNVIDEAPKPARPSPKRADAVPPPVHMDRGAPTMPNIDYGTMGDIFGDSPDATQMAHGDALKQATDSIDAAGEMLLSVISHMTTILLRVADGLSEVKDRLDSEDEGDIW